MQREQVVDLVDRLAVRGDRAGETAGRDEASPARPARLGEAPVDAVDQAGEAVGEAGLDRALGVLADRAPRARRDRCGAASPRGAASASIEISTPGPITPPRYSPSPETASKLVEVPKSTTTQAPCRFAYAATALTRRSAPSSCGLSIRIGIPVFRPGPTIRQGRRRAGRRALVLGAELRHDRGDDRAVDAIEAELVQREQVRDSRPARPRSRRDRCAAASRALSRPPRRRRRASACCRRRRREHAAIMVHRREREALRRRGVAPCWAVKRALELKGIDYKRVEWPPTLHVPLQRLRFSQGTVPGLV